MKETFFRLVHNTKSFLIKSTLLKAAVPFLSELLQQTCNLQEDSNLTAELFCELRACIPSWLFRAAPKHI